VIGDGWVCGWWIIDALGSRITRDAELSSAATHIGSGGICDDYFAQTPWGMSVASRRWLRTCNRSGHQITNGWMTPNLNPHHAKEFHVDFYMA